MDTEHEAESLPPGLYIVGTPIGHLKDITERALTVLRGCDVILAEDTRITSRLLARYDIRKTLVSHHKYNESARLDEVAGRIQAGAVVAMVTDSGMPGVSDPGARLVRSCRERGIMITAIPGPSALATAIALCGIESGGYVFGGFLPHKSGARRRMLARLALAGLPIVLYESPYRLLKLMVEAKEVLTEARVFVGRELTKKFEENRYGTPDDIIAAYEKRTVKGELVVVLEFEGVLPTPVGDEDGGAEEGSLS
jgi:16S rRNA (cytidine1402-2'-O)-methyltransferase